MYVTSSLCWPWCRMPVASLSRLRLRPWAFSAHQLATSWLILQRGSPSKLARLERPAIYFKGFLFFFVLRFNAVLLYDSLPAADCLYVLRIVPYKVAFTILSSFWNRVPKVKK